MFNILTVLRQLKIPLRFEVIRTGQHKVGAAPLAVLYTGFMGFLSFSRPSVSRCSTSHVWE